MIFCVPEKIVGFSRNIFEGYITYTARVLSNGGFLARRMAQDPTPEAFGKDIGEKARDGSPLGSLLARLVL